MPAATGSQTPLRCVISIDVEEEGLFRGRYERTPGAANVAHLERLAFCSESFGVPLTLLTAYPPSRDAAACEVLRRFHAERGAEIGAHLHHWNTPPFRDLGLPEPVRCHLLPPELLQEKLQQLTESITENLGVRPTSFRMGRFDFCQALAPMLAEAGYSVDTSIAPTRCELHGPDHFRERAWVRELYPGVLEVPLTTVPVSEAAAGVAGALARRLAYTRGMRLQRGFAQALCAGIHPLWFPLASMKLATRLHIARGGRVLNMFLHSSELMPGGSPQVPDEAAAQKLADKIRAWLAWLHKRFDVVGSTLSDIAAHQGSASRSG